MQCANHTTFTPDVVGEPAVIFASLDVGREPQAASWAAAEAAFGVAADRDHKASRDRIEEVRKVQDADPNCQHPWLSPQVAPYIEAERRAQAAAHAARDALIGCPAPDWRAFSVKFHIVREHCDDVINPLDHRDAKRVNEREFPGSRLAGRIHHYALGLHVGAYDSVRVPVPDIPKLLVKLASKASNSTPALRGFDPSRATDISPLLADDWHVWAFTRLYQDAVRLSASASTVSPDLTALLDESDRLFASDFESDVEHAAGIDELNDRCAEVHRQFVETPPVTTADALAKLKWLNRAFTAGETGQEGQVIAQLAAFLGGHPEALRDPDYDERDAAPTQVTLLAAE